MVCIVWHRQQELMQEQIISQLLIEYVPFGEVFIEERNNKWNTPYLFNAKELDDETGL
ncbi:hypothetical protein JGH11_04800 [Dysgonomonas sp. Marseille-P4677]|uniref:hypothetical protein n=1 Tax=Dysgonomonas sp. Marseille-P4677 TaxID=2364790 RepID=UPI001911F8D4|nr:hypothetical protein [Dysgonomonas sp. Marseille-P4677]MBK5720185.1 hypothetical protein [Dysgonomonas sp. Marseille-P4677]